MADTVKDLEYYAKLPYTIMMERHDDKGTYWVARVAELPRCTVHGSTPEEAVKKIEKLKMNWIKSNLEEGLPIPEPAEHKYSGEIRVRMPPSLHSLLTNRANIEGVSLNQYMVSALARVVGWDEGSDKTDDKKGKNQVRLVLFTNH